MKNILLLFALILSIFNNASADIQLDKLQSKNIIIRTNRVIGHAQMSVKRGGNYSGDLYKSVIHARTSRKLYLEGNYLRAIHHSRLARQFAVLAIKINKVKLPMDAPFTTLENQLFGDLPNDEELYKEAALAQPDLLKDQDLMSGNLLIDLIDG